MKRGQIAVEYVLLVGIALLALIPISYYAITESSKNIRMNEASDFVDTLAYTANMVYALGPGSQDYISVTVPGGVKSITFDRNEVEMKMSVSGKDYDVFAASKANLTGSISTSQGTHHVYVRTLDNETVEIGEY